MHKLSSGHLLSIETFCSSQWFWLLAAKALIRLRGCAIWSGPLLSAYARRLVFAWLGPYNLKILKQRFVVKSVICIRRELSDPVFGTNDVCLDKIDESSNWRCLIEHIYRVIQLLVIENYSRKTDKLFAVIKTHFFSKRYEVWTSVIARCDCTAIITNIWNLYLDLSLMPVWNLNNFGNLPFFILFLM